MSQRGHTRKRGRTWTAYWFTNDNNGERRQRSKGGFHLKSEATAHLTTVLADVQAGTYVQPRKITLAQFVRDEWIPTLKQRPNTRAGYVDLIEGHVLPRLGGELLASLTPAKVQALYNELAVSGRRSGEGGLSGRSVLHVAAVLRMVMERAVRQGFIPRNPAAGVDRPRVQRTEMTAWSAEEARAFLAFTGDHRLYVAWLIFLTRGLRRGEIAGLRWMDVDLEAPRLSIRHTRVSVRAQAMVSEPKTAKGFRTIPLDDTLVAALKAHRRRQLEDRMASGEAWTDSGYVFTREDGLPYHPEHFSTAFDRLVARSGLRRIRLHDTRHTAATLSLQAGIATKVVSEWLGHASTSITEDLYRHAIPSMQEEAGAKLTALILGNA